MFDTAEAYAKGQSEVEMYVVVIMFRESSAYPTMHQVVE